jgi:hypothetical protein
MANLTVVIDTELLKRARRRALDQGTSVNALLRDYLERYAGAEARGASMRAFVDKALKSGGRSSGRWTRDELHERR